MAEHVHLGLTETHAMLVYRAADLRIAIEEVLLNQCGVRHAEVVGEYRRRVEVIEEIAFVIETDDFDWVLSKLERNGGRTMRQFWERQRGVCPLVGNLIASPPCRQRGWGVALIECTGPKAHVRKLIAVTGPIKMLKSNAPFPTDLLCTENSASPSFSRSFAKVTTNRRHHRFPIPYSLASFLLGFAERWITLAYPRHRCITDSAGVAGTACLHMPICDTTNEREHACKTQGWSRVEGSLLLTSSGVMVRRNEW